MEAAEFRERLLDELRLTAEPDRVYRTTEPWAIGPATGRGDPNYCTALPLAEALANTLANGIPDHQGVIISFYDPTVSIPQNPSLFDRYIASADGNGWTTGHIYEWTGAIWIDTTPRNGMLRWIEAEESFYYPIDGTWYPLGQTLVAHGLDDHTDVDLGCVSNGDFLRYIDYVWYAWNPVGGGLVGGFDADMLDGKHAVEFALSGHTHDALYAALSHNHSAAHITSGTLSVTRGGTGAGTFTAGYLKASGTSAFTTTASIPWADLSGVPDTFTPAAHDHSHNSLSGLDEGDYRHLSATHKIDLTDGGDSSLHYHSADRNRANHSGTQAISTVSGLQNALDSKQPLNSKLTAISNLSVTSGNIIIGNGSTFVSRKLQNSDLPAIAITDTFVVANQSAMLALSAAERGDIAIRLDLNKSFILKGDDYSKLEDWQELLTPTDTVLSVDGRTGVVSLSDKYQPLDSDLTAIAGLTHSNRHVLISNGTNWTRRALDEADLPSLSISKITNLQTALDSKQPADATLTALAGLNTTAGFLYQTGSDAFTKYPFGTSANTVCEGDDSRLSDARTPTAHAATHLYGGGDAIVGNVNFGLRAVATDDVWSVGGGLEHGGIGIISNSGVRRQAITFTDAGADARAIFSIITSKDSGSTWTNVFNVSHSGTVKCNDTVIIDNPTSRHHLQLKRANYSTYNLYPSSYEGSSGGNALRINVDSTSMFSFGDSGDLWVKRHLEVGGDLIVGATNSASDKVVRVLAGDAYNAGFEAYGASQGTGYLFVGQSSTTGGGIFYNGDGNPTFASGETKDRVTFYRRTSGENHVVFEYSNTSSNVNFMGDITAVSMHVDTNEVWHEGNFNPADYTTTAQLQDWSTNILANQLGSYNAAEFTTVYNDYCDNIRLIKKELTSLQNGYAGSIAFGARGANTRHAAIAAKQTGSDANQVGLAFFTHAEASISTTYPMVEKMVLDHNGTLSVGGDLIVGATNSASNSVVRVLAGDNYNAGFEAYGASQGTGYLFVGQSSTTGGGIFYNGDGNPTFASGETKDRITFYRRTSGENHVVFEYSNTSSNVNFMGDITAVSMHVGTNEVWHEGNLNPNDFALSNHIHNTLYALDSSAYISLANNGSVAIVGGLYGISLSTVENASINLLASVNATQEINLSGPPILVPTSHAISTTPLVVTKPHYYLTGPSTSSTDMPLSTSGAQPGQIVVFTRGPGAYMSEWKINGESFPYGSAKIFVFNSEGEWVTLV